jgi:hypothetical protein
MAPQSLPTNKSIHSSYSAVRYRTTETVSLVYADPDTTSKKTDPNPSRASYGTRYDTFSKFKNTVTKNVINSSFIYSILL